MRPRWSQIAAVWVSAWVSTPTTILLFGAMMVMSPCLVDDEAPPAGTADRTLWMQANAPIRSRSPDRSVRVRAPTTTDKSTQRHHGQKHPESHRGPHPNDHQS